VTLSLGGPAKTDLIEDRFYRELPASGIAFIARRDGMVRSIQLYADGRDGYRGFAGVLPDGISVSDNRSAVLSRLGQPGAFGGGTVIPPFGKAPRWDRFDRRSDSLHVEYTDGGESIRAFGKNEPIGAPAAP
jgi:hypothetical protein